jgi:hypothetical protein|tara:strand:- start:44 stop:208 length:165 start_codon:yes stop_codon:yes gene_type:complete
MLLNPDDRTPFEVFAKAMYVDNCAERREWQDEEISYEQYVEKNMQYLLDNFKEV